MQERDIKGALRILGIAVCAAAVAAAPAVKSVYPRTAMLILGLVNLVQLCIDEGRARERRAARSRSVMPGRGEARLGAASALAAVVPRAAEHGEAARAVGQQRLVRRHSCGA